MQLDSVQIAVPDLDPAVQAYRLVLGIEPIATTQTVWRFPLQRGAIELESGEGGLQSLRFVPESGEVPDWPPDRELFNGLDVRVGSADAEKRQSPAPAPDAVCAIDHVVVNTSDLDRAIALWRDRLGIRLALDREFLHRGLRMCFFRTAGITLEFVGSLPPPPERNALDRLYGLAYQVTDLVSCRARLVAAGVDVSEIRPGNKSGTAVATVRSHTAGVPTLLIEATDR